MKWKNILRIGAILALLVTMLASLAPSAGAAGLQDTDFPSSAFAATWSRTDLPVQEQNVSRTWMWGPEIGSINTEQYAEAPGGQRQVVYLDKTRMEDNTWRQNSAPWYITNGLLAKELMTGQEQVGDNQFLCFQPANVFAVGDDNGQNPTYAEFGSLMNYQPLPNGWDIDQQLQSDGTVFDNAAFIQYHVKAMDVGAPTSHNVASVFWDFMNSSGLTYDLGSNTESNAKLFENPFYATGYPLTEAYWANVFVGGKESLVLTQVFERRVLTYTPSNPDGWKVEAGNVGQQYYKWRYEGGQVPCSGNTPPPSCSNNCGGNQPPPSCSSNCDNNGGGVDHGGEVVPNGPAACTFPTPGNENDMPKTTIQTAPQNTWFHRVYNESLFKAPDWGGADSWYVDLALGPNSGGNWTDYHNPGQIIYRATDSHITWCLGLYTSSAHESEFLAGDQPPVAVNVKVAPLSVVTVVTSSGKVIHQKVSDMGDITIILPNDCYVVISVDFTTADHSYESMVWWGSYSRSDDINTVDARN